LSAQICKLAYQLRYRRLGQWGLDRWAITLALGILIFLLIRWLLRGTPLMPAGHWTVLALLAAIAIVLLGLRWWGANRSYVVFVPQPGLPGPAGQRLAPADKILLRATGRFEVEGKTQFHADLLAYWRTFASREHAVMAIAHEERFLLLGSRPAEDVGMWYIFFRPETIQEVGPGELAFGARRGPALRVTYLNTPPATDRRKHPRPTRDTVHLVFEDEPARQRVWADLVADGDKR
jgi:hypothetical protein